MPKGTTTVLDFPWAKTPDSIPEVGSYGRATLYGGAGYRPARVLDVSPRGTQLLIGLLDPALRPSDRISDQGGIAWIRYGEEGLAARSVLSTLRLPWDGQRYYRVGLGSMDFEAPEYLGSWVSIEAPRPLRSRIR